MFTYLFGYALTLIVYNYTYSITIVLVIIEKEGSNKFVFSTLVVSKRVVSFP